MIKTVSVSGFYSTGSSAVVDLLNEFEETQVLNKEFRITSTPDGLEDLEYHLRNPHSSIIAIERFRNIMKNERLNKTNNIAKINEIVNNFLTGIIQYSWKNFQNSSLDWYLPLEKKYKRDLIKRLLNKFHISKIYNSFLKNKFNYNIDLSMNPENFSKLAETFINEILYNLGIDYKNNEKNVVVLNNAFWPCDPIRSFKYFKNPSCIIVDRDPRDHYLFTKYFLLPKGKRLIIPYDNIENYIGYYRLLRKSLFELKKRNDILYMNFEELVYDCENAVNKIANFIGITKRIHKGQYFKPTHSRNNTKLFLKFKEHESEIKMIEKELPEYLFPFDNYPDILPEGEMFFGSQIYKKN